MKRRWFFVLCSVLIVLVIGLSALHVRAQGGDQTLQPGVPQTVTLNAGQALTRTFSLSAGDTAQFESDPADRIFLHRRPDRSEPDCDCPDARRGWECESEF